MPTWLPESALNSPLSSLTATPRRSESGSVPNTTSACILSASAMPMDKVSLNSGLGTLTVENSGSLVVCSSTTETLMPRRFRMVMTGT